MFESSHEEQGINMEVDIRRQDRPPPMSPGAPVVLAGDRWGEAHRPVRDAHQVTPVQQTWTLYPLGVDDGHRSSAALGGLLEIDTLVLQRRQGGRLTTACHALRVFPALLT